MREEFNTSVQQQRSLVHYLYQFVSMFIFACKSFHSFSMLEQLRTGVSSWIFTDTEPLVMLDGIEEVRLDSIPSIEALFD